MHTLGQLDVFLNIIVIVTIISLITRRLRIPSAVVLIIAGLISTFFSPESLSALGPEIFTIEFRCDVLLQNRSVIVGADPEHRMIFDDAKREPRQSNAGTGCPEIISKQPGQDRFPKEQENQHSDGDDG